MRILPALVGLFVVACTPFTAPEADTFTGDAAGARASGLVRVVTWNIETVGRPGSREYDAALQVLQRLDPDVLALNEIADDADADDALALAADLGFAHTVLGDDLFGGDRNGVFSRFPFAEAAALEAADLTDDERANDITRHFVTATVLTPGGPLDVVSMHWKSGWEDSDEFRRVLEGHRAAQLVHDAWPVVLTGDWNDDLGDGSDAPQRFTRMPDGMPSSFWIGADLYQPLTHGGLDNDPFAPLEDAGLAILAPRQRSGTDATRPISGRRLDYFAVTPDLVVGATEVYDCRDEGLQGELLYAGAPLDPWVCGDAADHLPVVLDVVLEDLAQPVGIGSLTPGDLVVSELLANPEACPDDTGEWIELRNTTAHPIALAGLQLVDASGNVGHVDDGVIAAGGLAVLGRGATPCGPVPVASYSAALSLNNGGDAVHVVAEGTTLDTVVYGREGAASATSWASSGATWCANSPSPALENPTCD